MVISQADSCADGEQPCHVIDQSAASLDQQEANGVSSTGSRTFSTHNGGSQSVANTHQNTTDGQRGNGQHQRLAELCSHFIIRYIPPNTDVFCRGEANAPGGDCKTALVSKIPVHAVVNRNIVCGVTIC